MTLRRRHLVVFSGGSAANSLVDVFDELSREYESSLSYVIPISDNGGSSSELIRVFGGPSIGDIRSRLVRLIPDTSIRNLFNHRLPQCPRKAAAEFSSLLTGDSELYSSIPTSQTMLIRSILSHVHVEILKRNRPPSSVFNFKSASIGNLFLTGARLFTGSFESAIYLLAIMGGIDESKTAVLPAIVSNFSHHISAGLADGSVIVGQNSISHPSEHTAFAERSLDEEHAQNIEALEIAHNDTSIEDANLPGSLPTLRQRNLSFSKSVEQPLPARIERVWYINPYGHEMRPIVNPKVIDAIKLSDTIIYSIGSLYTSIVPSLILRGVGEALTGSPSGPCIKILILNSSLDRETGGLTAVGFIDAITSACIESQSSMPPTSSDWNEPIDKPHIWRRRGVASHKRWHEFVTHLIYLEGKGTPAVDEAELDEHSIRCVRLSGLKLDDGSLVYDHDTLSQALKNIIKK